MVYVLVIPTFTERRDPKDELWFVGANVASGTLLRDSEGVWTFDRSPVDSQLKEASLFYRGGYRNIVEDEYAAELQAQGFGSWLNGTVEFNEDFNSDFS